MREARARRSSGSSKEERRSTVDRKRPRSDDAVGPLWGALSTDLGAAAPPVQRACAACSREGPPCPTCAGEEVENRHTVRRKPERSRGTPCSCGGACGGGGGSGNPGLEIGAPDDRWERRADAVARRVVRRTPEPTGEAWAWPSGPALPGAPLGRIQRRCPARAVPDGEPHRLDRVQRVLESPGSGAPVGARVRARTEPVLGADLSDVRVHADARARRAARDIGARAFTHGRHVFLGAGESAGDLGLMAHELTHTVQQGASPALRGRIQRNGLPSIDLPGAEELRQSAEEAYEWGTDRAGEAYDRGTELAERGAELAGEAYERGRQVAGEAYGWGTERAGEAYEWGSEAAEWAWERTREAAGTAYEEARGVARDVWNRARELAGTLGGIVTVTGRGVEIRVPEICPDPSLSRTFALDPISQELMAPVFELPVGGTFAVGGSVGVVVRVQPRIGIQAGPICLRGLHIVLNPLTGNGSVTGTGRVTTAVSLGSEVRGGLRGALSLDGVIPVQGVPIPISIPLVGLEGGLAGMVQGTAAGTISVSGSGTKRGGVVSLNADVVHEAGLAGDLFAGAYGQLDVGGENVCRLYWQPVHESVEAAISFGMSLDAALRLGAAPSLNLTIRRPTVGRIPFDAIPLALSREGFSEDCPLRDRLCRVLRTLNLLPRQRGGEWKWDEAHPWGPGRRLPPRSGPLSVHEKAPGRASGAECRGACGPDCRTCDGTPACRYSDPATGDVWVYTNFQRCRSNAGCRQHDAAFDWAADVHGETGTLAIIYPWHMAANIECACENLAGNCAAWIVGFPPYDMEMFFAEFAWRASAPGSPLPPSVATLPPCRPTAAAAAKGVGKKPGERPGKKGAPRGERKVEEDPLTSARARTIPGLVDRLDDPRHVSGTVTLVGGASSEAGLLMFSRFITDRTDMGSEPSGQDEIYGYGKLPQVKDVGGSGYTQDMVFVKGHLLNHSEDRGLGGEGVPENLFPITGTANKEHNRRVEEPVKELVHDERVVVRYRVVVANVEGPHLFDVYDGDPARECLYQYINADFLCDYATYRLYTDGTIEPNEPKSHAVDEDFDEEEFRNRVGSKKCPNGDESASTLHRP